MLITKKFYFDAAHRLHTVRPNHPCRNLHGHRYEVEVGIQGDLVCKSTMLIDYHDLAPIKKFIDTALDHATLVADLDTHLLMLVKAECEDECGFIGALSEVFGKVAILPVAETTAECMAEYFKEAFTRILRGKLPEGYRLSVSVSETPNTAAFTGGA